MLKANREKEFFFWGGGWHKGSQIIVQTNCAKFFEPPYVHVSSVQCWLTEAELNRFLVYKGASHETNSPILY